MREREENCFYIAARCLLTMILKRKSNDLRALNLASELEFVWGKCCLLRIDFKNQNESSAPNWLIVAANHFRHSIELWPKEESQKRLESLISSCQMEQFIAFFLMYHYRKDFFGKFVVPRASNTTEIVLTGLCGIPVNFLILFLNICVLADAISLASCYQVVDKVIEILGKGGGKVKVLNLSGCFRLGAPTIQHITKLKHLKWLALCGNYEISKETWVFFAQNCPETLEYLDLSSTKANDDTITHLSKRLSTNLLHLKLTNCQISDAAFAALGKSCPNLVSLAVNRVGNFHDEKQFEISDKGIASMVKLQKLKFLDLSNRNKITDRCLTSLQKIELKKLSLVGCKKISSNGREKFCSQCPNVKVFPS